MCCLFTLHILCTVRWMCYYVLYDGLLLHCSGSLVLEMITTLATEGFLSNCCVFSWTRQIQICLQSLLRVYIAKEHVNIVEMPFLPNLVLCISIVIISV